jgi:hypothetical protein
MKIILGDVKALAWPAIVGVMHVATVAILLSPIGHRSLSVSRISPLS